MALPSDQTRAQPPSDSDRTAMPLTSPLSGASERALAVDAAGEQTTLALSIGTRLNEFEITGVIGEGGFGIVYAAHDHSLDRAVALKEYMPGALATRTQGVSVSVRSNRHRETFELGLKSFVNEARLLARFDHPSLVKVYRFWEAHGTAYMVMPHYQGETLKSRLKSAGASPDEAWLRKLLASLLEALDVIHQENVFHRDIAPDNILLLDEDVPVLLDFGAARTRMPSASRCPRGLRPARIRSTPSSTSTAGKWPSASRNCAWLHTTRTSCGLRWPMWRRASVNTQIDFPVVFA